MNVNTSYLSFSGTLYTAWKISRVQLEHAVERHRKGLLVAGGMWHDGEEWDGTKHVGCIMQHLLATPFPVVAHRTNLAVSLWFDQNYKPTWADWMLREAMMKANLVEEDVQATP